MSAAAEKQIEALKALREQYQEQLKHTQALLKDLNTIRKEIRQTMKDGPMTIPELAHATNLPTSQVLWHVAAMKKYGLVAETELDENYYRYTLVEEKKK